jgi:hypothetical protein
MHTIGRKKINKHPLHTALELIKAVQVLEEIAAISTMPSVYRVINKQVLSMAF